MRSLPDAIPLFFGKDTTMVINNRTSSTSELDPFIGNSSDGKKGDRSSQPTLRTYALAGLAAQIAIPDSTTQEPPEIQFLRHQLKSIAPGDWMQSLSAYLNQPAAKDLPLIQLSQTLDLTTLELLTVVLAATVEEEVMVGRALAHLQAPVGGSRPTLSLLAAAFAPVTQGGSSPINTLVNGVAVRSGLLCLLNEGTPLPERGVKVPLHLCLALSGEDGIVSGTTIGLGNIPEVPLPASILDMAQRHATSLENSRQRVLVLRTGSRDEGRSVATAIAQCLGCRPLFLETNNLAGLEPWLLLRQLLPVFCWELAPGERQVLPPLPFYGGPILALCGPDGSVEAAGSDALNWLLPVPSRAERQLLWQRGLGHPDLAADLARHHRHGSGRIAQLGRLAHHYSRLQGRTQPTAADVAAAAWLGEGTGLEALAQPLTDPIPDEALVMGPLLKQELNALLLRCRARDGLVEGLGASATARYHPGVRALFVGPSGTGKTLAAGWLATKLGMPLYRVDLASITSKYIGETEKNLAQLLARAEQAEVVLLFDEADSLFGKRTEVQQANDRFANAQTNYLLQRIETFDGITLLTSNSRARFDDAFSRRLDLVLEFPLPRPEERKALWQSHLGDRHSLKPKQFNQLATTVDLCGGHIRNTVLAAAVLAQAQERPLSFADVVQGLEAEYRKLGRQLPVVLKSNA